MTSSLYSKFSEIEKKSRQHIWIIPVLLLCFATTGRGVGNSLSFLFVIWGLLTVRFENIKPHVIPVALYSLLILSFFGSSVYNGALDIGTEQLIVFTLYSIVFVILLSNGPNWNEESIRKTFILIMLLPYLVYIGRMSYFYITDDFHPIRQLSGITIAVLFPLLIAFSFFFKKRSNFYYFLIAAFLVLLLLIVGDSRTAPVIFLSAIAVYFLFAKKKPYLILLVPAFTVLVILLFMGLGRSGTQSILESEDWVNRLSSQRLSMWQLAIEHPPESMLFGAGVDNTEAYLPETILHSAIHNGYIELWYETGFLGFGLWLFLIGYLLKNIRLVYMSANRKHRQIYAAYLASLSAVLLALFLSKGYMSIHFKFFMFYLGAMLYLLGEKKAFTEFKALEEKAE